MNMNTNVITAFVLSSCNLPNLRHAKPSFPSPIIHNLYDSRLGENKYRYLYLAVLGLPSRVMYLSVPYMYLRLPSPNHNKTAAPPPIAAPKSIPCPALPNSFLFPFFFFPLRNPPQ